MWKGAVKCEFEGEDGGDLKRQSVGAEWSQDRLRTPGEQGTVEAGPVLAQRGHALFADPSLKSALTSIPRIPPPKALPEICLLHATESERALSCHPKPRHPEIEAGQGPAILAICFNAQGARIQELRRDAGQRASRRRRKGTPQRKSARGVWLEGTAAG